MEWQRSSACESATCVEVTMDRGMIGVRNSQAPADILWFTRDEWEAFAKGTENGEFSFEHSGTVASA